MAINHESEQRAMDAAIREEQAGLVLQAVGWTLLLFCSIPAVFLFVGWRAGSWLWFWFLLGPGAVGMGLVAGGIFLRNRSTKNLAALSGALRSRSFPSLKAEELPPPEDVDHRAA